MGDDDFGRGPRRGLSKGACERGLRTGAVDCSRRVAAVRLMCTLGAASGLRVGTGLVGTAALAACQRTPAGAALRGIDLTGAPYGRSLRLADPQGRERTLEEFRGRVVLLFFGYTQCPDVCPTALARAKAVRARLGAAASRLQVVFVTVDPERDNAELLAAYTAAFDPAFLGLRGDAAATAEVAREFRVVYMKVPTGSSYAVDHTALSYLIDPAGRLRVALAHGQSVDDFEHDIRALLDGA